MGIGIGKLLGGLVKKGIKAVAPQVSAAINIGKSALSKLGRRQMKRAVAGVAAGGALAGVTIKKFARTRAGAATAGAVGGMAGLGAIQGMVGGPGERRRYRRINPGNSRAMRRAIRRVEAGARLYSRFFRIRKGGIKGAPGVRVKMAARRAA